jgi:hypothetical protein
MSETLFGRSDLDIWSCACRIDTNQNFLFPTAAENKERLTRVRWNKAINAITGKDSEKMTSYTPESKQQLYAELKLMAHFNSGEAGWLKVDDAWHASLMPEGCFCRLTHKKGEIFYVVRSYQVACATLPAVWEVPDKVLHVDRNCKQVQWRFFFGIDDVEVWPTQYASPLHLRVLDSPFCCSSLCSVCVMGAMVAVCVKGILSSG